MSATATLAIIDMAMGALEVATRANQLLNTARAEGREVTDAEFQALVDENKTKRAAWDEAINS
jgi:hypothetical protein